jgi:hypothetical protein
MSELLWTCSKGHPQSIAVDRCIHCGERRYAREGNLAPRDNRADANNPVSGRWVCKNGHEQSSAISRCVHCGAGVDGSRPAS